MTKPYIAPRKLNPWLTSEEVESLRIYYTTLPTDNDGKVIGVGNEGVRNDIVKLIAEVKRLQPIDSSLELAVKALEEIRRTNVEGSPVKTYQRMEQIADSTLDQIRRAET